MFGFHCRKLSLNIVDRRCEPFECVFEGVQLALCSIEHYTLNVNDSEATSWVLRGRAFQS